jgi:hypothetical protein
MTDHIGHQAMELTTWMLTGTLPSEDQIADMARMGTAAPVVAPRPGTDEDGPVVDLFPSVLAHEIRFDRPVPLHRALADASWAPGRPPALAEVEDLPGDGIVIYVREADGRDRLGVLYRAARYQDAAGAHHIKVLVEWAPDPLPSTVAALRAERTGPTD